MGPIKKKEEEEKAKRKKEGLSTLFVPDQPSTSTSEVISKKGKAKAKAKAKPKTKKKDDDEDMPRPGPSKTSVKVKLNGHIPSSQASTSSQVDHQPYDRLIVYFLNTEDTDDCRKLKVMKTIRSVR